MRSIEGPIHEMNFARHGSAAIFVRIHHFERVEKARVVRGQRSIAIKNIFTDEKLQVGFAADGDGCLRLAARAGADEVADVIHLELALRQARSGMAEVINDVVAEIESRKCRPSSIVVTHARIAGVVMNPKIVVKSYGAIRAGERAIPMRAFVMFAVIERFANEAPLNGHILLVPRKRKAFVDRKS